MYDAYNTIENHQHIPKQAFLYFPNGDSKKRQQDDFKMILPNNQLKRLIYEGNIQYLDEENQILDQFIHYIHDKQINIGKLWTRPYIYKFLQSTGYNYKKSIQQMLAHNNYKAQLEARNFDDLKSKAQQILNKGTFYFNGRDSKFRPILVVDIKRIHTLKLTQTQIIDTLQYFFQFMYRNMFINGQVQNVVGVIDVGGTSPFDLIQPMKITIGFLQGNYKYKLHAIYIIRSTSMFKFAFGVAKQFMKEDTIRKVNVLNNDSVQPLLQYCNPSQLQKRFGGTHQNLKQGQCWPPRQFSKDFSHPNLKRRIVSEEEYALMFRQGLLPSRKICLDFVKGQDSCEQLPLLNSNRVSIKLIQNPESRLRKRKPRNVFSKIVQKLTCKECYVSHYQRK